MDGDNLPINITYLELTQFEDDINRELKDITKLILKDLKRAINSDSGQLENALSLKQNKDKNGYTIYENKNKNSNVKLFGARKRLIWHLVEQQSPHVQKVVNRYEKQIMELLEASVEIDAKGNIYIK